MREVALPLYPTLSISQVEYVVQSVNKILHPVQIR
jgi:dTDP-4-amino-4,6-dideoxygalactose transaminase